MRETITLSELAAIFDDRGIGPDSEYTAAAGQNYGYVAAWELPDGGYLISYADNGTTSHALAEDADDLACWLESPDLDSLFTILQTANVRGREAVEEAEEDAEGPFYVLRTRYWYGPAEISTLVSDGYSSSPAEFSTFQDAQDWIDAADDGVYILSHNESGAPSYKIVTA